MGTITIKTIIPPNTIISSVDPISETSSTGGVVVGCRKNAVAERSDCNTGGIEYVTTALENARIKPILMMMAGRASFFIILRQVYHALIRA